MSEAAEAKAISQKHQKWMIELLKSSGGSCTYEDIVLEGEKQHCDTVGAMLKILKRRKVVEYAQPFLMYPMHKKALLCLSQIMIQQLPNKALPFMLHSPCFALFHNMCLARAMVTSGALWATGDIIAQIISSPGQDINLEWKRVGQHAMFASFIWAPVGRQWYPFLSKNVKSLPMAIAVDQLLFTPCFLASFFTYSSFIQGNPREAPERIKKQMWPTLQTNWMVWPFVQAFNMSFVPVHHRLSVVNCVTIPWSAYLAILNHKPIQPNRTS